MIEKHPNEEKAIAVGAKMPAFALLNDDNQLWRLSPQGPGKPLALVFYRGDW